MKAVRVHSPGGPANVRYEELPTPPVSDGEVLVRVHAAAITRDELDWPADRLPAIPSYEVSGTVVASEVSVDGLDVGSEVFGMTSFDHDGVAAEFAAVPAAMLGRKPESVSHIESAAIPLPGLSALQGLFSHGRLAKNERVLIHGGGGGVGGYAVQVARLHGAHVIATASGLRVDLARRLGADEVIDHTKSDFTTIEPVDLVFDTTGGNRLASSVEVLGAGGRLISVAEDPPDEECESRGIEAEWFLVDANRDQLTELAGKVDGGLLQALVDQTYPLADARNAFEQLDIHNGGGKLVLVIDEQ